MAEISLADDLTFEQWKSYGWQLCRAGHSLSWQIGDWWVYGEHRYGDRAAAAAEGIFGRDFGTLRNLGSVARSFETSRRHDALSFSHHQEVASLPPETADRLLNMAESQGLSKRELRREVQAIKVPVRVVTELNHLERPDLHDALQLIIDLAQEIEGYRDLTEEEEKAVADAAAYLDAQGYWAARDREFLKTLAHRRDWLPDAQAEFPHRTVPALQCMMQKVRAELGMSDQRTVDRVMVPDSGRMVAAIQLAGVHP